MSFIRTKKIGKNTYGYVVENNWKKRKSASRQKVSQYLGRIITLDSCPAPQIEQAPQKLGDFVKLLVEQELLGRGFQKEGSLISKDRITFDLSRSKFVNKKAEPQNIVLEMNEGFLCPYTLRKLVTFRLHPEEDDRERAIKLAKNFLEAGLRVESHHFITIFEKLSNYTQDIKEDDLE